MKFIQKLIKMNVILKVLKVTQKFTPRDYLNLEFLKIVSSIINKVSRIGDFDIFLLVIYKGVLDL